MRLGMEIFDLMSNTVAEGSKMQIDGAVTDSAFVQVMAE